MTKENPSMNGAPQCSIANAARQIWDVAIIGAGPSGSTAAIHLAAKGHRVLLLDKDDFPRDKVCGDGLIADTIAALKRAGLYKQVLALGFESTFGTVYSPSRIAFDVSGQFITLKRIILDELILQKALDKGAEFCKCKISNVAILPDNLLSLAVEGSSLSIRAKIIFIATGANIELPAKLGLVTQTNPSAVALRCYVRSPISLDRLVISYDRSITPGYAWIFPLGSDEFNIGCGITYRDNLNFRPNLRAVFRQFVDHFPLASDIMSRAESIAPLRGAMLRCGLAGTVSKGCGSILVLGESIGSTFPFTGEGIGKAMETGELAAEVAHQALSDDDFEILNVFPERVERELKPKFLGYQIAEDWFSKPWLNDFIARRINKSHFLQQAISGLVNETVDPRKIFSLRGILRSFFN
jgi:geranylgeranyl reductase family protein